MTTLTFSACTATDIRYPSAASSHPPPRGRLRRAPSRLCHLRHHANSPKPVTSVTCFVFLLADCGPVSGAPQQYQLCCPNLRERMMAQLVGVAGSLRRGSFNAALLRAAVTLMPGGST